MSAAPPDRDDRNRIIRSELGGGVAVPDRLREALERAYGIDLGAVRLHEGDAADGLARSLHADAFTVGADVFFRAGALRPGSDDGVELLAHEVAHVVQQAGSVAPATPEAEAEAEAQADASARAFVGGRLPDRPRRHRARPLAPDDELVLQRHSSWEHRMLGDLKTAEFGVIAGGGDTRKDYLRRVQQFLLMWANDPDVSAARITQAFPDIRTLTLRGSGLVVTYGELNTLADYLATPAELDTMPRNLLMPLLQQVRQEGYAWVTWVIEDHWVDQEVVVGWFKDSVAATSGWDTADAFWETRELDAFTKQFGPRGINSYSSLLSRNACHFAPHSWYRWEQFYLQARAFALEARHATGARKDRLTNLTWLHHGYADHFLHDSFAAGHLVNKTLVMQWYLDWVGNTWTPVPDWDLVQLMTLGRQPDLAGRSLYSGFLDPAARGAVRDPQTASEHWSLAGRMAASGVRADGSTVAGSYKRWLAFLGTAVVQLASNTVHDHFNSSSLWVSSEAHPGAFQLYGDNTMIRGGEGYQIASSTAQLSQRSIIELLGDPGRTDITTADIARRFPSRVHDASGAGTGQSLEEWAYGYQSQAGKVFDGLKNRAVGSMRVRIAPVTIDSTGGWVWKVLPGNASDVAVGGDGVVWTLDTTKPDGKGNNPVQYWDPTSSSWKAPGGAGVRIAADGDGAAWVVNAAGDSYRRAKGDTWKQGRRAVVSGVEGMVDVAAGTDGSVWGLAKATVPGGHQLMRCVLGADTHTWQAVSGGASAVSVAPDGLPWVVNDTGVVMRLVPGTGTDRYVGDGATWVNVSPPGRKAVDVGLSTGALLRAWVTTDAGILGWNGRGPDLPRTGNTQALGWDDTGGRAVRVASGPDSLPWVVNEPGRIFQLAPGSSPTADFATADAGKVTGTARASGGSLFQDESVSINGSTDLSRVVVGNSDARVYSIQLKRSVVPGVFYTLFIDGQGPKGLGSGSMYIYLEDEGRFTEHKWFFSSVRHTLTIDYNGTKAGITRISWSAGDDPAPPR